MKYILGIFIVAISCSGRHTQSPENSNLITSKPDSVVTKTEIEQAVDSTSIGTAGKFKIDVQQFRDSAGNRCVEFNLYKKSVKGWTQTQHFKDRKDGITGLELEFHDFNNDGLNDMTFRRGIAARSVNELRLLFIFDRATEKFIEIKNSGNYPNLRYNKELNCIDAWLVYNGSSTVFFKIKKDSLKEFAGIDLLDSMMTVYEIDEKGQRKILRKEQIENSEMIKRFKNYRTLEVNTE